MNDFVRKRDKGMNIHEKIERKKALCKKAGVVRTFEGYFYEKLDSGVKFYLRDTKFDEHQPQIISEPTIPLFDFSKQILITGDDKPESSDEDDGFKDIPS